MARRGVVTVALAAGLTGAVALGGAGGYGYGMLATSDPVTGAAVPLVTATRPGETPPAKVVLPDHTPALQLDDLRFKTRWFTVKDVVRSDMSAKVPGDWKMTQPDPAKLARFTDPTTKRWIRIEGGFTIQRSPATSMKLRVKTLEGVPREQLLTILDQQVEPNGDATLAYTYVPDQKKRYVIIRWVGNKSGDCHAEVAVTGLPQDRTALRGVLERASESVTRSDSGV